MQRQLKGPPGTDVGDIERQHPASVIVSAAVEPHYASIRDELEKRHYGLYVMIDAKTLDYVLGRTVSDTHAKFIERFGEDAPGWCTRIGASAFAGA